MHDLFWFFSGVYLFWLCIIILHITDGTFGCQEFLHDGFSWLCSLCHPLLLLVVQVWSVAHSYQLQKLFQREGHKQLCFQLIYFQARPLYGFFFLIFYRVCHFTAVCKFCSLILLFSEDWTKIQFFFKWIEQRGKKKRNSSVETMLTIPGLNIHQDLW